MFATQLAPLGFTQLAMCGELIGPDKGLAIKRRLVVFKRLTHILLPVAACIAEHTHTQSK